MLLLGFVYGELWWETCDILVVGKFSMWFELYCKICQVKNKNKKAKERKKASKEEKKKRKEKKNQKMQFMSFLHLVRLFLYFMVMGITWELYCYMMELIKVRVGVCFMIVGGDV